MSTSSMIASIRNNLNLLPKRDRLKYRLGGYNQKSKIEYNLPKATSKQLRNIKKRLQSERKNTTIKVVFTTAILAIAVLAFALHYLLN